MGRPPRNAGTVALICAGTSARSSSASRAVRRAAEQPRSLERRPAAPRPIAVSGRDQPRVGSGTPSNQAVQCSAGRAGRVADQAAGRSRMSNTQTSTRKSCQFSGTPLRRCVPTSDTAISDPTRTPFTVSEMRTCAGPARSQMRFAMVTASPAMSSSRISISPVWRPARTFTPTARARVTISIAHRAARVAPLKSARKPSPVVLTSRPPCRRSASRTTASWRPLSWLQVR